jgi:hypothetical protein
MMLVPAVDGGDGRMSTCGALSRICRQRGIHIRFIRRKPGSALEDTVIIIGGRRWDDPLAREGHTVLAQFSQFVANPRYRPSRATINLTR